MHTFNKMAEYILFYTFDNSYKLKEARTRLKVNQITISQEILSRTGGLTGWYSNLETGRVSDNEPKISIPDIDVKGKELSLYRYLVGTKNIVLVKRFVELALSNKSIPSTVVQAYLPAIKMLHDIVSGGPSYVSMLRALADRAKKNKK